MKKMHLGSNGGSHHSCDYFGLIALPSPYFFSLFEVWQLKCWGGVHSRLQFWARLPNCIVFTKCTTQGYLHLSALSLNTDGTWLHHNIVLQESLVLFQSWLDTFLPSIISSYNNQGGEPHFARSLPSSLPLLGTWDLEIQFFFKIFLSL